MILGELRVVDLLGGIAGGYATKLLADAGADVVVVEPPGGRGERRSAAPGLFDYLNASKRSVGEDRGSVLLERADLVVAGPDRDLVARRRPDQVVVTVSPFGLDGPWVGRPWSDLTLQAECAGIGSRGLPGETPTSAGGRLGEWLTGSFAAVGGLAAWMTARRSGQGAHLDLSLLDAMSVALVTFPSVFAELAELAGRAPMLASTRSIEVPSIAPTADGWVNFTTNSAQQFSDFCILIGRPELGDDPEYARAAPRFAHREAFWAMTEAYTRPRTTEQVLAEAALLRLPAAAVLDGSSVQGFEQFVDRQVFVEHPSGRFRQPRPPYRIHGLAGPPLRPVPGPAEHDADVLWAPRPGPGVGAAGLPLDGVRVVDFTAWWAGPSATQLLGTLGADVVKVESAGRPDLIRYASVKAPGDPQWWEWGPLFAAANTNKRSVTLDLTSERGHELVLRLVARADMVVENFTPRVMPQLGLDWEQLRAVNSGLIMLRMPAFGLDGPWRDRTGFAQTMESVTGMAAATGYPDGPPLLVRGAGDPLAGLHACFAALVALVARTADDQGRLVESTMVEAALNAAAEQVIGFQLTGRVVGRLGNRSPDGLAPQGVYRCGGEDWWVALSVADDEQWRALTGVLGEPETGGPFDRAEDRVRAQDALDAWLSAVCATRDVDALAEALRAAGVPAAVVIVPATLAQNPQLVARRLFEEVEHPVTGTNHLPAMPYQMSGVDRWLRRPAPTLGQHTAEILAEVGVGDAELDELAHLGVIGEAPETKGVNQGA